jgi:hypothetical protein
MERKKKNLISNRFILRPSHAMDIIPQQHGSVFGYRFAKGHRDYHRGDLGLRRKLRWR